MLIQDLKENKLRCTNCGSLQYDFRDISFFTTKDGKVIYIDLKCIHCDNTMRILTLVHTK